MSMQTLIYVYCTITGEHVRANFDVHLLHYYRGTCRANFDLRLLHHYRGIYPCQLRCTSTTLLQWNMSVQTLIYIFYTITGENVRAVIDLLHYVQGNMSMKVFNLPQYMYYRGTC